MSLATMLDPGSSDRQRPPAPMKRQSSFSGFGPAPTTPFSVCVTTERPSGT
jgi:hypothetical protein